MLVLPHAVYDELIDHAITGAPNEVCGILGGEYNQETSRVVVAEPAANAAAHLGFEYRIDPEEHYHILTALEADGHDQLGFYHSHPTGPPNPSATDISRATWPAYSYVIISLAAKHPFLGSWRWNGDAARFEQEPVRLTP